MNAPASADRVSTREANAAERSGIQRDAAGDSGVRVVSSTGWATRRRLPLLGRGAGRSSRPQKAERYLRKVQRRFRDGSEQPPAAKGGEVRVRRRPRGVAGDGGAGAGAAQSARGVGRDLEKKYGGGEKTSCVGLRRDTE